MNLIHDRPKDMTKLSEADCEKFNQFIFSIDDSIEELLSLGRKNDISIDYSDTGLISLEALIVKLDVAKSDNHLINIMGQFLGEYFRKKMGGQWSLGDDPDSSISFNQPVIAGFNSVGFVFNPIRIIRNFVGRRMPGLLARAVDAQKGADDLNLTPEE
jgi:hypothetical protein